MKKMNIGLVGAGFMGKAHMVAFSNMPKLFTDAPFIPVFKTVCDIVPEIAEDFKERYGFEKACTDWMDIINDHLFDRNDWCRPEKHRHTSICNGMSFSHKSCTNQTDIHFFRTCIILIHFYSPFRPAAKSTNEIS